MSTSSTHDPRSNFSAVAGAIEVFSPITNQFLTDGSNIQIEPSHHHQYWVWRGTDESLYYLYLLSSYISIDPALCAVVCCKLVLPETPKVVLVTQLRNLLHLLRGEVEFDGT